MEKCITQTFLNRICCKGAQCFDKQSCQGIHEQLQQKRRRHRINDKSKGESTMKGKSRRRRKRELRRLLGALLKVFTMMNGLSAVVMGCLLDSERYGVILGILVFNIVWCVAYFYFKDARAEKKRIEAERRAMLPQRKPRRNYQLYNLPRFTPEPAREEPETIDMWITI